MNRADLQARRDATAAQLADLDALLALPDSALAMVGGANASEGRGVRERARYGAASEAVVAYVAQHPGCKANDIRRAVGSANGSAHQGASRGRLSRRIGPDGVFRFYIPGTEPKEP